MKKCHKKWWGITLLLLGLVIFLAVVVVVIAKVVINYYACVNGESTLAVNDYLLYIGSGLAFIGAMFLGITSLIQNFNASRKNDELQAENKKLQEEQISIYKDLLEGQREINNANINRLNPYFAISFTEIKCDGKIHDLSDRYIFNISDEFKSSDDMFDWNIYEYIELLNTGKSRAMSCCHSETYCKNAAANTLKMSAEIVVEPSGRYRIPILLTSLIAELFIEQAKNINGVKKIKDIKSGQIFERFIKISFLNDCGGKIEQEIKFEIIRRQNFWEIDIIKFMDLIKESKNE